MGTHIKEKRSKPKKKSIKSKALDKNSTRRLATFGKKMKAGHAGEAVQFIARTRAVKKLQLSLKDFRRLCILKGIYPREPPNKSFSRTCYHVKDIAFLAHEPLLEKFREHKSFMKKLSKLVHRKEHALAMRKYEGRPIMTYHHLIRERYPKFVDSLADMDDALSLLHLFATLPSVRRVRSHEAGENCLKLCREWQLYVAKSRSLRKSFVSVKGIYYQAEVCGQEITWIVPHNFAQDLPHNIDYDVMATFLQFYECLVGFVMFKLYHSMGVRYPPNLDLALDASGAHLECIQLERLEAASGESNNAIENKAKEEVEEEEEDEEEAIESESESESDEKTKEKRTKSNAAQAKRLSTLQDKLKKIQDDDEDDEHAQPASDDDDDNMQDEEEVFGDDPEAKSIHENARQIKALTNIFKDFTFFLSREVPFTSLEFIIRSFGGRVLSGVQNEKSQSITHFVTDRENRGEVLPHCEYIQPQWVYDCTNFRVLIPVSRYRPGADLPPHLSPFVDNTVTGYKPDYAKYIESLQSAAGVKMSFKSPVLLRDITQPVEGEEEANAQSSSDEEGDYAEELNEEVQNGKRRREAASEEEGESSEEEEDDDEESEEDSEDQDSAPATKVEKKKPKKTEFVSANKFAGKKDGYVFRSGESGLGYYLDTNAKLPITFNVKSVVSNRSKRMAQKKEELEMRKMMMSTKAKRLYNKMDYGIKQKQKKVQDLQKKKKAIEEKSKTTSKKKV